MDFELAAYKVHYSSSQSLESGGGEGAVFCDQTTYAHRGQEHLVVAEFVCTNRGADRTEVRVGQAFCDTDSAANLLLYGNLCPRTDASSPVGFARVDYGPPGAAGGAPTCSISTMNSRETPDTTLPVLGECHTFVPEEGLLLSVGPGKTATLALVSARYSNMDDGRHGNGKKGAALVSEAHGAWKAATADPSALTASHVAAMAELHRPGIEVEGNDELARVVNSSLHALLGSSRGGWASSAPEGLVSTRYGGHAFWDVETWQWPTWLAFWPDQAKALLDYRHDLMAQALANAAQRPSPFLPNYPDTDTARPDLRGLRYPWESANSGVEQSPGNSETHIMGDISTAFRQYWAATQDTQWLEHTGFPVIKGIATFYASRVVQDAEVPSKWHIERSMGPDEYHDNVTDSSYGNAVASAALKGAHDLAALVPGEVANATFLAIAAGLDATIPYDAVLDYHPEFVGWNRSATPPHLIKQADTVMMYYPLNVKANASTKRNDMRYWASVTDPHGVAMTYGIHAIVRLQHNRLGWGWGWWYWWWWWWCWWWWWRCCW